MPFVSVRPIFCAYVRGEMEEIAIIRIFFQYILFSKYFLYRFSRYFVHTRRERGGTLLSILIFAVYPTIRKMKNIEITDISCELKLEKELFRNQERKVERAP